MQYRPLFTYKEIGDGKININILGAQIDISENFFYEEIYDELIEIESNIGDVLDKILS